MAHAVDTQQNETSQQVLVLRFPSGEEVIGQVTDDGFTYTVKQPLGIGIDQGAGRLVFVPFMPYTAAGQGFEVSKQQVLFATEPVESILNDYNEATGNGKRIISPPRQLLRPVGK